MKILITSDWYAPVINGVVTSILNLQHELEKEGHEVMVLTLSGSRRSYRRGNVFYVGSVRAEAIYPNARLRLRIHAELLDQIIKWKPDVIHSQCEFSSFTLAKKIAHRLSIPLVHTYHTIYEDYTHYFCPSRRVGKKAARAFSRMILNHVDWVIAPTAKTAELLEQYGVHSGISVIPSGLELDKFTHHRNLVLSELGIPETHPLVIYLGRLAKEKNLQEIFAYLENYDGAPFTFVIVGDGPYRETLEEDARLVSDKVNIHFLGMVNPQDVPSYYSLGDLFVSASQSETQGLTYIEAAAAGLPLLCKEDECLAAVLVPGDNGWMFENRDQFLGALSRFLSTSPDDVQKMRNSSIAISEAFDIRNTVPKVVDVYEKAIQKKQSHS
ncbi:MAG: glycosyltransferase [Lachnospiraceae bacterium]|nr:glycosyltransferase [Lachnospiraceae bacterium]